MQIGVKRHRSCNKTGEKWQYFMFRILRISLLLCNVSYCARECIIISRSSRSFASLEIPSRLSTKFIASWTKPSHFEFFSRDWEPTERCSRVFNKSGTRNSHWWHTTLTLQFVFSFFSFVKIVSANGRKDVDNFYGHFYTTASRGIACGRLYTVRKVDFWIWIARSLRERDSYDCSAHFTSPSHSREHGGE